MKIKWLGHASFLIISDSGTKIITDPYTTGGPIKYGEIKEFSRKHSLFLSGSANPGKHTICHSASPAGIALTLSEIARAAGRLYFSRLRQGEVCVHDSVKLV